MSIKKKLLFCMIMLMSVSSIVMGFVIYYIIQMMPSASNFVRFIVLIFSFLFIFVILSISIMMIILIRSVITPLNKLYNMTEEIKKGNLDFKIDCQYHSKNEFGKIFNEFDEMRERLKTSLENQLAYEKDRKEMIVNIAHDIKTPITSISGHIQGVIDGIADTPEKQKRYFDVILQKSKIVDQLVNDLFLFSKLDMKREHFKLEKVYLKNFFTDIFDFMMKENQMLDITLQFNVDEKTPIYVDPFQFKRVIQNIVDNSVKYKAEQVKKIEISTIVNLNQNNNGVTIKLKDNGIGVNENDMERIFDQFFRSDVSRTKKGSGLGLSISKQIVEAFGGRIWARSKLGGGLAVYISLPYVNASFIGVKNEKSSYR